MKNLIYLASDSHISALEEAFKSEIQEEDYD